MQNRFLFLLCLLVFTKIVYNQEDGHIFVSNYSIDENFCDRKINAIEFDNSSTAFIANKNGVVLFDGQNWLTVKNTPKHINCIKFDTTTAKTYVGSKDEIGYIDKNIYGSFVYKRIERLEKQSIDFTKIYISNASVYFYSEGILLITDRKTKQITSKFLSKEHGDFSGALKRKESFYINIEGKGVCKINSNSLEPISGGSKFKNSRILFCTEYNNNQVIIGTNENKIYLFDGNKFEQFASHTEIRKFLEENILWDGINISGKYFAASTLTGGCAIIDKIYGKIIYTINFQTGLPDDEIYSIGLDRTNGLWLAHEQGLSRCELDLPIRSYSSFPGLYGSVNDVLNANKNFYVATNEGVFKLSEVKNYKEIEKLIKEKVTEPVYHSTELKKGLFKKKQNITSKKYKTSWVTKVKKEYALQSIRNQYLKLGYIEEKCRQIQQFDSVVLASTNFGLYEIQDSAVEPVISDAYINDICKDDDSSIFYIGTLEGIQAVVHLYDSVKNEAIWKELNLFENINSAVYSIAQTKTGDLVLGLENGALFCKADSLGKFEENLELKFPEDVYESINVVENQGGIYFIQSAGIFALDESLNSIGYTNIEDITENNVRYLMNKNQVWLYNDSTWKYFNKEIPSTNLNFIKLFNKCKSIHLDEEGDFWVLTDNKINKILSKGAYSPSKHFNVEITSITDNRDSVYTLINPSFEYENNTIKFKLSAPYYYSPQKTLFQYKVQGLKNYEEWTKWTSFNHIDLSSVPPGNYTIQFRAKNVLSQISEIAEVKFKVLIPFWQTTEFLVIIASSFIVLVLLGFYITNRRLVKKKRILEQKVKERTIELEEEKNKTEALLLNILPKETAEELKEHNKVIPRNYDNATVLFTDFKGFTQIAEKLTPEELVHEIDYCFKEFDGIINKYKIEKIKTIGDAYMCAGGLPTKFTENAQEVLKAALEIRDFMENYKGDRQKEKRPFFEIRIGIHTGKVVAGVVGTKKYAYDIWGDTVNVASRMESSGEPGKVNISGDTYELIKNKFKCTHRGKVEAKNKGEIDMYFVEELK